MANLIRRLLDWFSIEQRGRGGTKTYYDGIFEISRGYQSDEECTGVSLGDRYATIHRAIGTTTQEDIEEAKDKLLTLEKEKSDKKYIGM